MMMNYPPQSNYMYSQGKDSTLYIGDLDDSITNDRLFAYFSKFGNISNARVMRNSTNHKSRGYGFVSFFSAQDAERARVAANHEVIIRKPIRVCLKKSMKEIEKEANVFLKEVDPAITIKEIDEVFSAYGKIFSSKISTDDEGNSCGYGYVQFQSKAEAEECLSHAVENKIVVAGKDVTVERFVPYSSRDTESLKRNLYFKNFPTDLSEAELNQSIMEKLKPYGEITSAMVKTSPELNRVFAFVCFESHEAAKKVLEDFNSMTENPFGGEEKLYVGWAQSSESRKKALSRNSTPSFSISETNLFLKNLKSSVTEDSIREAFAQFGELDSIRVKSPEKREVPEGAKKFADTKFAFVSFKSKEEAKNALYNGPKTPEIQSLFETVYGGQPSVYISFHMNASSFKQVKENKKRTINYSMIMRGMKFMEPYMMGMPPQNFNGQQMMGHPQQYRQGGYNRPRGNHQPGGPRRPQYNNNNRRPQYANGPHQRPPQKSTQQPAAPIVPEKMTIQKLNEDLQGFLQQEPDKQRVILGELLFPLVSNLVDSTELAPKVTGMLIDLDVFEVKEIVEFIESQEVLKERVDEAIELLKDEE